MARAQNRNLRRTILEEAIEIVYREGPDRVTMRSLAENLGYSVATIYIYFHNKDELLREIALHGFDALAEAVAPAEEIDDPSEAVREAAIRYVQFGLEQPELYRLMFQDISVDWLARLADDQRDRILRAWELNRRLYRRGIERGDFPAADPDIEAIIGWAWVHGFVQLAAAARLPLRAPGSASLKHALEAMVTARVRALRPWEA